jgi:signal transduction histidine kinase
MDLDSVRTLKHELRTPINHIMGYSGLVIDEATDACDQLAISQATEIFNQGKTLFQFVEQGLLFSTGNVDPEQLEALKTSMLPLIKQITESCSPSLPWSNQESYASDLGRIREAANCLISLVSLPPNHPHRP